MLTLTNNDGRAVCSFAEWAAWGLPETRRRAHWKEGRSACELAREWTRAGVPLTPDSVASLFARNQWTRGLAVEGGVIERETPLPFGPRGPRCHDLALWARNGESKVLICVEAKADESFGATVAEELAKALARPATRFPARLSWLTRGLLGVDAFADTNARVLHPRIAGLPYQLLPAIAGTLLEAARDGAHAAIFLVHEFRTELTHDEKMERNAEALDRFLRLFLAHGQESRTGLRGGEVIGPLTLRTPEVPGNPPLPRSIPLFLAKLRTDRKAHSK